ncbi:hypothetical protein AKO1_007632 [Acrasis kona]|uniref:Uncharacterized protein n=1 Tax=Acrasis kona TaxID=1008807 RepID=A0AAW2YPS8_9EUKA
MDKMAVDTRLSDAEKKQIKEALEPSKEFLKKHLPSKDTIAEMNALDKRIAPILERSQKLNKLENAADQLKRRLDRDVNLSDSSKVTTPQERETINKAIQKARDYVKNNIGKQTPMDQIAQQDAELQKAVDPILSRLDARNALHDYIDNANRSINNDDHHLSPSDQSLIKNACEESNKWSRANPRADKQQLDQQLNQLKNKVRPIMDQSLKKKDLLQLADSLQQKGQEGSGGGSDLTSDERRLLSDHARHIKDWLNDNPNADARELDKQLRHSKSKTDPIANRADQRDQLTSQCNQLRNALRNDRLAKHISHQDKNILQDMIDETVDYLNRNKNKSTKDLKQKKDALEAASRNILEKARAHQALDDYIDQTADKLKQLSNRISPMDQVKVNKALEQAKQFNKGADANDARDKLSQLKNQVDHVINRAQRDQELHDKVNHLVDRVNDKNDALHKQLTPKQFNQIVDQVQKQQDWINGPSHKQADADQLQNRIQDFDKSVMPLVQKADSKQALDKYISDSKQSLSKAEMDPQESKKLSDALDGAKQWLKAHPDVNKRDYDDKKSQVQAQVQPSLDRSKERSDLINYASNIREKVSTDPQLASLLNADDKKLIDNRANETIDWVKRTPDAKLNQIKEKKKALENTVNAVLESKDERNNLLDYAKKVLDVLNNNQAVRKAMTDKEQQAVDDYAQSVLDWLASNPNATANQIRDLKKSLEDNLAKVKNFKFVVPYKTFVGFRFNEQTRWGISGNRSTDIVYGSYLQQQERRDKEAAAKRGAKVATSTAAPKPSTGEKKFKVAAKSKYSIPTKQEEEDLKLFQTLKGSKGGLIQAKLSSLIDTTGRVKAEFGAVVDDQPQQSSSSNATTYSYAQLKNGAKYPPGIDTQKREQYLSDAEFVKLFNMTKSEFNRMPNFKQISTKKALELFQYEYQK